MDAGTEYMADEIAEMTGFKASGNREFLKHFVDKELIVASGEKEIVGIRKNSPFQCIYRLSIPIFQM